METKRTYNEKVLMLDKTYGEEAHQALCDWNNLVGYWLHCMKEDVANNDLMGLKVDAKMLAQASDYVKYWKEKANELDRSR